MIWKPSRIEQLLKKDFLKKIESKYKITIMEKFYFIGINLYKIGIIRSGHFIAVEDENQSKKYVHCK